MAAVLVDTGFLVALYRRRDDLHDAALRWLETMPAPLITASPVLVEACHFLGPAGKVALHQWVIDGGMRVFETGTEVLPRLARSIRRYAQLDIDLADAALIWLAEEAGVRRILTVDQRDFTTFRLRGRKSFDLVRWYS
ncbi:MAG TPA: PIN domain-containing protein [Burkholderiaceae bacterium]